MGFTYLFQIPNEDSHQVDQKIIEKPVPAKKKNQNESQLAKSSGPSKTVLLQ